MLSDEEAADVPPPVALQAIEAQKPK
jgi:hypothetical protein